MAFVHGQLCPKGLYTGQVTFIRGPDGQLGTLGYPTPYPHGNGSIECLEGGLYSDYVGQWYEGHRQGQGVTTYRNGDTYSGTYENDRRHGLGDLAKANGRRYVGEFVHGRRQGKGEMTFPNGDKYTGDWNEGRRTGHGLYLFANGNRYVRT